jgi:hypothetical protein
MKSKSKQSSGRRPIEFTHLGMSFFRREGLPALSNSAAEAQIESAMRFLDRAVDPSGKAPTRTQLRAFAEAWGCRKSAGSRRAA